jgi:hypothetical protein
MKPSGYGAWPFGSLFSFLFLSFSLLLSSLCGDVAGCFILLSLLARGVFIQCHTKQGFLFFFFLFFFCGIYGLIGSARTARLKGKKKYRDTQKKGISFFIL